MITERHCQSVHWWNCEGNSVRSQPRIRTYNRNRNVKQSRENSGHNWITLHFKVIKGDSLMKVIVKWKLALSLERYRIDSYQNNQSNGRYILLAKNNWKNWKNPKNLIWKKNLAIKLRTNYRPEWIFHLARSYWAGLKEAGRMKFSHHVLRL